jgi:hypothetical protein
MRAWAARHARARTHTHTHTHTRTHRHTHTHTHRQRRTHTHIQTHTRVYTHSHAHTWAPCTYADAHLHGPNKSIDPHQVDEVPGRAMPETIRLTRLMCLETHINLLSLGGPDGGACTRPTSAFLRCLPQVLNSRRRLTKFEVTGFSTTTTLVCHVYSVGV